MSLPKSSVGLACILVSVILTRIAAHSVHAGPQPDPQQIWMSMSPGLKALVLGSFLLLVFGAGTLLLALINWMTRRKS